MKNFLDRMNTPGTPFDSPELVAKRMRGEKTDEEWQTYLEGIAERQVEILNQMVAHQGPSNIHFSVTVEDRDARRG
jgi:hypothetical protein